MAAPLNRVRAWRTAFAMLRRSSGVGLAAAQELLLQPTALVRSASDLPHQEVSGDIQFLLEVVSSDWHFQENSITESVNVYSKVCQLLGDASSHLQLEFKPASAAIVSGFLTNILTLHKDTIDKNVPEAAARELFTDTFNALGQFVHASGQNLGSEEANALLISILPLMVYNPSVIKSRRASGVEYAALGVVGNVFIRAGASVSASTWQRVIQAYRTMLDNIASRIVEDASASRYYSAFLRSLHMVLSDVKGSFAEHVGAFVASLRMFFAYGLPGSRLSAARESNGAPSTSDAVQAESSRGRGSTLYRPPHLRAKHQENRDTNSAEQEKRISFSDSEQSDTDASGDADHFRSSKTRTNAVLCIHAIARADPKLLHAHWSLLLPTDNVLHPRLYQPTLMTTIIFDPVLKTRIAAATALSAMLEGPARAFLQVAEFKESSRAGSFTTLSTSLGQIIVQLHKGLTSLISKESHGGMLIGAFKSLSLLVSAAPFDRLPAGILSETISGIHKKILDLSLSSDQSLQVAAFSCLNASLCASSSSSEVKKMLLETPDDSRGRVLCSDLILFSKHPSPMAVCFEALQALKSAVHHHAGLANRLWTSILDLVQGVVEDHENSQAPPRNVDDKTVYHALKLLDECLRSLSGFKGAEDTFDFPIVPPSPSQLPQPATLMEKGGQSSVHTVDTSGISQWQEALEKILAVTLKHPAPGVRSAALTCFAGLTPGVYSAFSQAHQAYIFSAVIHAAREDEAATVRSAACRALGIVVAFPEILESYGNVGAAITTVQATVSESSLSVRITSCWALANICDALCKFSVQSNEQLVITNEPLLKHAATHTTLAEIALKAAKDGDKVRANAVRALGNLARFVDFSETSSASSWLAKLVQTLVSCITTGNVKVQWNVCHALGNLFLNKTIGLHQMTWTSSVYSILLLLLRDSGNFKIRIHAATALAVPCRREDFGESYGDVVHGLLHALESLQSEQAAPSGFKYISTLWEQLTSTLLHVLGLALPEDYAVLKDSLSKKGNVLYNWLQTLLRKNEAAGASGSERHCIQNVVQVASAVYQRGGDDSFTIKLRNLS